MPATFTRAPFNVLLLLLLVSSFGCGGGGKSGSTSTSTSTPVPATGTLQLQVDTTVVPASQRKLAAAAVTVTSYRIHVVHPASSADLVPPVTVARSSTGRTQTVEIPGVPVGPVIVLVEALDVTGLVLGHSVAPATVTSTPAGGGVSIALQPGPAPRWPVTPSITNPPNGATNVALNPVLEATSFASVGVAHAGSRWVVYDDASLSEEHVVWRVTEEASRTARTRVVVDTTAGQFVGPLRGASALRTQATYFAVVAYLDGNSFLSATSLAVRFITGDGSVPTPTPTPTPTPPPPPSITSASPAGGPLAGGTTLTITGANFGASANVSVGTAGATEVAITSGTTITCVTPAAATSGAVDVIVMSLVGTAIAPGAFTYNAPPSIASVIPAQGPLAGGTVIAVTGTGFDAGAMLTIDGAPCTAVTVTGGTTITATTPASSSGEGAKNAIVTAVSTGTVTRVGGFTYNPAPTITAVTPGPGPLTGGNTITVDGTRFFGAIGVTVGGVAATNVIVVGGGTSLTCTVPAAASPGAKSVTVTSSTHGAATASGAYTYNPPLTLEAPIDMQSVHQAGTVDVLIRGTNLLNVSAITFGSSPASGIVHMGGVAVTCQAPAGAGPGQVTVTVTSTTHGVASLPAAYTYKPDMSFAAPVLASAGGPASSVLGSGDFDRDGIPDLVTRGSVAGDVSVHRGTGASFAVPLAFNVVDTPDKVLVLDLDRDGDDDILTASGALDSLSILRGDGAGGFAAATTVSVTHSGTGIASGDLDRDGDPDVVVVDASAGVLRVLANDGAGNLGAPASFPAGSAPFAVGVGDFDRDGKPDAVVTQNPGTDLLLLRGNGDATFAAVVPTSIGNANNLGPLVLADAERDGRLDVSMLALSTGGLRETLGNGNGTFAGGVIGGINNPPGGDIQTADMDGDGVPDLVVSGGGKVDILTGTGGRRFGTRWTAKTFSAAGALAGPLVVRDMNRDGRPDVVTTEATTGVLLLLNTTTFLVPVTLADAGTDASTGAAVLTVGDYDRNGRPDVVSAGPSSLQLSVRRGSGGGTFTAGAQPTSGTTPTGVSVGDVNGDGRPDLIATSRASNAVTVFLDDGAGSYGGGIVTAVTAPVGVATADFDHDGDLDLAVADAGGAVRLLRGNNTGSFTPSTVSEVDGVVTGVVTGDFDRDGHPDAAVSTSAGASVCYGTGAGAFDVAVDNLTNPAPAGAIAAGDLDRDGVLDLVTIEPLADTATVRLGLAGGGFSAATSSGAGTGPVTLQLADFDRDGRLDVFVLGGAGTISVLPGNGAGGFSAPLTTPLPSGRADAMAVSDYNRDGLVDVLIGRIDSASMLRLGR